MMLPLNKVGKLSVIYAFVTLFALFLAFPFYWMLITSLKSDADLFNPAHNPFILNSPLTMEHLRTLFFQTLFLKYLLNTFTVGAAVVAITLVVAVPAAYSLARWAGRWGESLGIGIFLTYLVPPTLLFIPVSRVVAALRLTESIGSLILIYPTFTIPFCTWLLMGFFKSIPRDIEEQARIDGYSRMGALIRVVLPLSVSGLLTVVVFAFTLSMQEFIYALAFISVSAQKTVSIGVPTELVRGDVFRWGPLMAAALIASIPVAILYTLFLDRFIAGFTAGAIK